MSDPRNRRLAELLGWRIEPREFAYGDACAVYSPLRSPIRNGEPSKKFLSVEDAWELCIPNFVHSWGAAGQAWGLVKERLAHDHIPCDITVESGRSSGANYDCWIVLFGPPRMVEGHGATIPEAMTNAMIAALEALNAARDAEEKTDE